MSSFHAMNIQQLVVGQNRVMIETIRARRVYCSWAAEGNATITKLEQLYREGPAIIIIYYVSGSLTFTFIL